MEGPLPFLEQLFKPINGPSFPLGDAWNVVGSSLPLLKWPPKTKVAVKFIHFRALSASFNAEQSESTIVEEEFTFAYCKKVCWNQRRINVQWFIFEQGVANYFNQLLKCYSDAQECRTAQAVWTMTIEQFKSLTPTAHGNVLREPMVLVSSAPWKPIPDPERCVSHHCWKTWESYLLLLESSLTE